jgi:hypothetical protein
MKRRADIFLVRELQGACCDEHGTALTRPGQAAASSRTAAPVYGWFTEGFDTLDLKEAKALLDELHA